MAGSSAPLWIANPQQVVAGSSAQGPCWAPPADIVGSTSPWYTPENVDDSDPQAWGLYSHPPGGFLNLFKNATRQAQAFGNGTSSQPISVGDGTNGGDHERTEKRLPWTKEEYLRLVSAWLNNSNDPIQSNYKKTSNIGKMSLMSSTVPPQKQGKTSKASEGSLWEN